MKRFSLFLPIGLLTLCACSSKDEPVEDDCLDPRFRAPVEVTLNVSKCFSPYKNIDSTRYSKVDSSLLRTRADASWQLRYMVAAYRRNSDEPLEVVSSLDNKVKLDLPPDKYTFIGWADYVPCDGKSYYYHTDEFNEIMLRHKYDYTANDPWKVPYRGSLEQRVAYTTTAASVDISPAMGNYKLLATDTPEFKPGKILITYIKPMPCAVNGLSGKINYMWNDMSFESEVNDNMLASDYVLSEDEETTVYVRVEIYDDRNNLRARVRQLAIPLVNGGVTTVKGNFYSILDLDGDFQAGGITIDTEFDATIEIEI